VPESRFPLQNTYTLRKAGHFAQPLSFQGSDYLLSRQRVCTPLPAFGGPDLPLAAPPDTDGMLAPHNYAALFGVALFQERLAPDYLLRMPQLAGEWVAALVKLGKTGPFWRFGGT
jgi:hypothetical protein